jgi:hypothetical protein
MFEQVDETSRARYGVNGVVPPNKHCYTIGMDQGLHNWLLFSGRLKRVPRRGACQRPRRFLPWTDRYIANWNGDPSPVVHQLDRFE